MFLGVYHFDGDTTALLACYDRLLALFPPNSFDFHACVQRADGISVYDACPDRPTFEQFSSGPEFRDTIRSVGLPSPRVEQLGEVYAARARGGQVLA
jgi:hypothetical protein